MSIEQNTGNTEYNPYECIAKAKGVIIYSMPDGSYMPGNTNSDMIKINEKIKKLKEIKLKKLFRKKRKDGDGTMNVFLCNKK